jgi:hypothetical protein
MLCPRIFSVYVKRLYLLKRRGDVVRMEGMYEVEDRELRIEIGGYIHAIVGCRRFTMFPE